MATNRFKRLIAKINEQTEVDIVPVGDGEGGFYWHWRCVSGETLDTEELALIDWIKYICKDYENLLVEVEKDDDDDKNHKDEDEEISIVVGSDGIPRNSDGFIVATIPWPPS
jgi:hypothetical protein